jgi:DNA/RNA non-specific endonuclease
MEGVKQKGKAHQHRAASHTAGKKARALPAVAHSPATRRTAEAATATRRTPAPAAPSVAVKTPSKRSRPGATATKAPAAPSAKAPAIPATKIPGAPEVALPPAAGRKEHAPATAKRLTPAAALAADKSFQSVKTTSKAVSKHVKNHDPSAKKVADFQGAAKGPANETVSLAKDRKSDEMDQQQPGVFDDKKFKAALKAKIDQMKLNTLKEADEFKENNGAAALKGDMTAQVGEEKDAAAGPVTAKVGEQPDPSQEQPKVAGPAPVVDGSVLVPAVSAPAASPKPATDAEISLQKDSQDLDRQLADAKVTDKQLTRANEPAFNKAMQSRDATQKDAVQAPPKFRVAEKGIIGQSQAGAAGLGKANQGAMSAGRKTHMTAVQTRQMEAKAKDEANRKMVADTISQKFDATKKDVEAILTALDMDTNKAFDDGIAEATRQFEDFVDKGVTAFKDERYSGITGKAEWAYDLVAGPPDTINTVYSDGKNVYVNYMNGVIDQVAKVVATQLNAAKQRINTGKQEIKTYVTGLPKDLQSIGEETAKDINAKFSELESSVDSKETDLVDSLANKYKAGLENIDKQIDKMKEENKSLYAKAKEAVKEVLNTIIELKNMLLNILARAAAAIELIIDDPIGFLGNLVAGVKMGIQNFMSNIVRNGKEALMGWLFGTLSAAGIDVPKSFDPKGILTLVLQVLGLTYANIRSRAVNILGEGVVGGLEKVGEVFLVVKSEGIGGLWRLIQEKVSELKDTVMESIKGFVVQKIVVAGVTWLISLLNPASAFIKACKMIYDVIMFFVERGKQIISLVNAVIDSVTAIAKGAIGVAATAVENALTKALPVAIGFLASLLGLDGISEKIKNIIARIQAPINAAIDWVINKAVVLAKAAGKLFGLGKDKDPAKDKADKEERLEKGLTAAQKAVNRFAGKPVGKLVLNPLLTGIKLLYRMQSLEVIPMGDNWGVEGVVNPQKKVSTEAKLPQKDGKPDSTAATAGTAHAYGPHGTLAALKGIKLKSKKASDPEWDHGTVADVGKGPPYRDVEWVKIAMLKGYIWFPVSDIKFYVDLNTINEGLVPDDRIPDHDEFKPKKLTTTGPSAFRYETKNGASFDVEIGEDKLIKSIKGTKLLLKANPGQGRGIMEDPPGHVTGENLHRAHLIADQFGGSGYAKSANLITTSGHFNTNIMGHYENMIKGIILNTSPWQVVLTVEVKWMELLNDEVLNAILKNWPNKNVNAVRSEIDAFIKRSNPGCKRVADVNYDLKLNGAENSSFNESTGPDLWLGRK